MIDSGTLREIEERWEAEKLHTNQFAICGGCGECVELVGEHDIELIRCPACNEIGLFEIDKQG